MSSAPSLARTSSLLHAFLEGHQAGLALADDLYYAAEILEKDYIFPIERTQKRQRSVSSIRATQPIVEPLLITTRNANPDRHNKSVAPASNETGTSDDAHGHTLLAGSIGEAPFEDGVLMDWISMREGLQNIPIFPLSISTRPSLRSYRPPWYQLVTLLMSSSHWVTSKPYNASVGTALHLTLYGVSFSSSLAAP